MPDYRGFATSTVNDGAMTLFWKDSWLEGTLQETYPRAFSCSSAEDVSVQQFLSASCLADNF
jgi:hypothetical protein